MQTIHQNNSYYEEYKRTQHGKDKRTLNKLMTDRSSYMAFLEVELERVSAACMTVQAYKDQLSEINTNYIDLEEKLQQYSRALKLSSTIMDRRDHETNHKFDNMQSRVNIIERKQNQMETDCKMFLNSDMPTIYNEVKNIVKKQLIDITEKYANVEKRCNEMIHERLDGCENVYKALEKKLNNLFEENWSKFNIKMIQNNEEMKEWTKNYMKQYSMANVDGIQRINENIKVVEDQFNKKFKTLEFQILNEQPKYLKHFIKGNVKSIINSYNKENDFKLNLQNKSAERAELTCSKIADDVYKRLQNQRYDLFNHIKSVENRISDQLKGTIHYISDKNNKKSVNNNDFDSLKNEILDYKSEIKHSQQKLDKLENKFDQKLKRLQNETDKNMYEYQANLCDNVKLIELDSKYSEIQNSIKYLQDLINKYNPEFKKKKSKKKSTKLKCTKKNLTKQKKIKNINVTNKLLNESIPDSSLTMNYYNYKLPSHFKPHLSDLDNLVECVLVTDEIDKKHSNSSKINQENISGNSIPKENKTRKKIRKTSCHPCKPLWK